MKNSKKKKEEPILLPETCTLKIVQKHSRNVLYMTYSNVTACMKYFYIWNIALSIKSGM